MSEFTKFDSELDIVYDAHASSVLGDDYWRVTRQFTYYIGTLPSDKFVVVPVGFLSDGASTPFFVRALLPKMGKYSQAAFMHDWMCEHYTYSKIDPETKKVFIVHTSRKEIDRVFYEALKVLEVPSWKRFLIKAGLEIYRFIVDPMEPVISEEKRELEKR